MKRFQAAIEQLPGIFRVFMVLGVIVFISFLFPDNLKFTYHFERGRTWQYQDLSAPFDFAIKKTEKELRENMEVFERYFVPYYQLDRGVVKRQKANFKAEFEDQLSTIKNDPQFGDVKNDPDKYLNYGERMLDKIYKKGVIELEPAHLNKDKNFVINITVEDTMYRKTLETVLTVQDARGLLSDELPYSKLSEPDVLLPILNEAIIPNLTFAPDLTERIRKEEMASISKEKGKVKKGELIIPNNGLIDDKAYQKILSLKEQYEKELVSNKPRQMLFLGYFILTGFIVGVFLLYLRFHARPVYQSTVKLLFVMLWLAIYSYLVYLVENKVKISAYIIPFCIVPIVINTFFNARLAFFTHIIVVLIASVLSSLGYEFIVIQILAGIVILLSNVDTKELNNFFYSMLATFFTYAATFLGLSLIQQGDLNAVDWQVYSWFFLNIILTLLAIPLIPLLERFFGFTSSYSLIEMSDMNRPLLRELALKAPGTLQHSLQVANLSEAAAREIDADPLLVKVAALYHDVGKMVNPEFFIENQSEDNPHQELSNLESAKVIIGHVEEGVKLAKKYRLPKLLIDFIRTHHGTTRTEFFYRNFLKENPDAEIDESEFRYPGPRPVSKEETILMMADSVEAACKSLKNPTKEELFGLIDKVIGGKIANGQMDSSHMTFKEFEACKDVFKAVMKSVHHVRIEYPEEKAKKAEETKPG